ncbi:MAG: alpha/beta fold hydrolase [Eubacteriales bacterium]
METKIKKLLKTIMISLIIFIALLSVVFYIYTLDYYRADDLIIETLAADNTDIEKQGDFTVFYPATEVDRNIGFIFYPGGKVEDTAYFPLLMKLSQSGITYILVKMPFNLAVFNITAADGVYEMLPNIKRWYIGGHSLGGAMASSYAKKNKDIINGLILLAAYPVSSMDLPVIAIFGSEDMVLDKTKISENLNQFEIQGGNHAYFGNYGEQKGDGAASITRDEQQLQAVGAVLEFIDNE